MTSVRITTFNLWNTDHRQIDRLHAAAEMFTRLDADVIALQEVRTHLGNDPESDAATFLRARAGYAFVAFRPFSGEPECARSPMTIGERKAFIRGLGSDLVRLPGRLRRLAADPRTPRRARWLLIALAVYVASPIDPIPDVIPVIGHLDELLIVPVAPNVLARVRRMIPPEVWATHFPSRKACRD